MAEFYNRAAELAAIQRILSSPRAEFIIVFGRRGSGKSELLVRALGDRPAIYYQATTEVLGQQLDDLADELRRFSGSGHIIGRLSTLADALAAITLLARERPEHPLIVVIDEFPYLAQVDPGAETVIQKWWDTHYRRLPNLKLFLAGSHVSWMREHALGEHGPLQNRRTGQIELMPLDYRHSEAVRRAIDLVLLAHEGEALGQWLASRGGPVDAYGPPPPLPAYLRPEDHADEGGAKRARRPRSDLLPGVNRTQTVEGGTDSRTLLEDPLP